MPEPLLSTDSVPYTTRVLPPEEFHRLSSFPGPLQALQGTPDPEHTRVVVVEQDGQIVGYWVLFNAVHAEPLWLDPSVRHKPKVALGLFAAVVSELQSAGVQSVFAIIGDPERETVGPMAERAGLVPLPGTLYGGAVPQLDEG